MGKSAVNIGFRSDPKPGEEFGSRSKCLANLSVSADPYNTSQMQFKLE